MDLVSWKCDTGRWCIVFTYMRLWRIYVRVWRRRYSGVDWRHETSVHIHALWTHSWRRDAGRWCMAVILCLSPRKNRRNYQPHVKSWECESVDRRTHFTRTQEDEFARCSDLIHTLPATLQNAGFIIEDRYKGLDLLFERMLKKQCEPSCSFDIPISPVNKMQTQIETPIIIL